ncbi:hypothetical protein [Bradyrhizobium sp.]|uniref:hypothetical protein n=1 Tax=Bradyrhizobium sp. TaxID=376 RepID=UPI003C4E4692
MADQFNPAPHDKHATDPREAAQADQEMHARLEAGLIDSFPASDPASMTQPATATSPPLSPEKSENEGAPSLWDRVLAFFR